MNKPDRMSDERIAEIEYEVEALTNASYMGVSRERELLTALKAERQHSRELEAALTETDEQFYVIADKRDEFARDNHDLRAIIDRFREKEDAR